jgi:hypothetical protein
MNVSTPCSPVSQGAFTYAYSDVVMQGMANILTSFLRCPMVDCDPDERRDDEEEEKEGEAEDSE